jgi:hypothetical protein
MQAGIEAARAAMPGLHAAIAAWKARRAKELVPRG